MSRINIKLLVAGLCLAFATTTAQAQVSQMRLWSPYPDDQFGGGVYMNEGFYGTVGVGLTSITGPGDQAVGDVTSRRAVGTTIGGVLGTAITTGIPSASQIKTSEFEAKWVTSTEFELGNIQGHNGWYVRGKVNSPQHNRANGVGGGISIYDPEIVDIFPYPDEATQNINFWKFTGTGNGSGLQQVTSKASIGRLWGIVGLYGSGTQSNTNSGGGSSGSSSGSVVNEDSIFVFVPIPLTYKSFQVENSVNTWSVEAMYSYRFHPFKRGVFELLGGVRYTAFEEDFDFMGEATTKLTTEYTNTVIEILQSNNIVSSTGGSAIVGEGEQFSQNSESEDFVIGADLGISSFSFKAHNHLVGPQIGGRYTLANNRWRFLGEGLFFAALNRQNIYGAGQLGLVPSSTGETNTTNTNGNPMYAPISNVQNYFTYSEHFNEFSPCAEIRLEAIWHWTRAVSFKVGYEFLYMSNIARASAVNDYRMNADGSIFGVKERKEDRNVDTFAHGVMFTAQFNR